MEDTVKRLRILLDYWIEHNNEHEKEFRAWADKVTPLSNQVAGWLQDAANKMTEVSKVLAKAKQTLDKSEEEY